MRQFQNILYATRGALGETRQHDVEALKQALSLARNNDTQSEPGEQLRVGAETERAGLTGERVLMHLASTCE